jgi:hypothetical protein
MKRPPGAPSGPLRHCRHWLSTKIATRRWARQGKASRLRLRFSVLAELNKSLYSLFPFPPEPGGGWFPIAPALTRARKMSIEAHLAELKRRHSGLEAE